MSETTVVTRARRVAVVTALALCGATATAATASAAGTYTVADAGANAVSVFANLPGAVPQAPTAKIVGAATLLNKPMQIAVGPSGTLYVANQGANSVTEYAAGATGNAAPIRTISGTATGLASPQGIAVDRAGHVFVANVTANTVTEYAATAAGNTTPIATLSGTATMLSKPVSLAVDSAGKLFVVNQTGNSVTVYAPGANANAAPTARITNGLSSPDAIAITSFDDLAVANANPSNIKVYSAPNFLIGGTVTPAGVTTPGAIAITGNITLMATGTASGNVAAFASNGTVTGSNSGTTSGLLHPTGLLVSAPLVLGAPPASLPHLTVGKSFSEHTLAFGGQAPYTWSIASGTLPAGLTLNPNTGEITGTPTTPVTNSTVALRVTDSATPAASATNTRTYTVSPAIQPSVYVSNGANSHVLAFGLTPAGNVTPWTTFGPANGINAGAGLAFDPLGDLFVANYGSGQITEYAPGAAGPVIGVANGLVTPAGIGVSSGPAAPFPEVLVSQQAASTLSVYSTNVITGIGGHITDISGPDTGLSAPAGVVWADGLWWVANSANNTITAYSPTAGGDAAPVHTIAGILTGLNSPDGIATDAAGDLLVTNRFGPSVTTYAPNADGDVAPVRTILSSALSGPSGIDTDSAGNIYVANGFAANVVVFAPIANGTVAPFETFGGSNTGILGPAAVAVTPPFAILTTKLPAGRVHHRYLARLRVAEGTTPYRWSLRRGHLPRGLRLSSSGVISGRPSKPGRYAFTVRVRDSARHHLTLSEKFVIVIRRR